MRPYFRNAIYKVIFIFAALLAGCAAFSQIGISGPTCVRTGVQYQYSITGNWHTTTTMNWTVVGGTVSGSLSGTPVTRVLVTWNAVGTTRSVAVTTSNPSGSASVSISVATALVPGAITANKTQTINYNSIPATITCGLPTGGACGASTYSYQWEQLPLAFQYTGSYTAIAGATSQDLTYSQPLTGGVYVRRKVTETTTSSVAYSDTGFISVYPAIVPGTISPAMQTIQGGATTPLNLQGTGGGNGSYGFNWFSSTDKVNWTSLGVSGTAYLPPTTTGTVYYRVAVSSNGATEYSSIATVSAFPAFNTGNIYPALIAINSNTSPGKLTLGDVAGSNGVYTYQWYSSTDLTSWASLGNTSTSFTPGNLTATTYYKVLVTPGSGAADYSNMATVQVYPGLQAGTVTPASQTISSGATLTNLALTGVTGGSNDYSYQWQRSADNINWSDVNGASVSSFAAPATPGTIYYRVIVSSNGITATSSSASVTVNNAGTITGIAPVYQVIRANSNASALAVTATGTGNTYQWQSSFDNVVWSAITGTTGSSFSPTNVPITTYYRVVVANGSSSYTSPTATVSTITTDVGNFIRVRTLQKPAVTVIDSANNLSSPLDILQHTEYYDGLGRLLQTVEKQATPNLSDKVIFNIYDRFGREPLSYLPYASTVNDGLYKQAPNAEQNSFNATQFPGEQLYYSRIDFDGSPDNKVMTSYAPGDAWTGKLKGKSSLDKVNTVQDSVRIWNVATAAGAVPVSTAIYGDGSLYKDISIDEQQHQVIDFKDKNGLILLRRVQLLDAPVSAHTGWLNTYYVYDDLDNLRYVIPPKAVEWLLVNSWNFSATGGSQVKDGLCFRYEYDLRQRMIIKKMPGAEEIRMVYDVRDRLVMTQDSVLRSQKKWQVFCYDALNRQDSVALMTDNTRFYDHSYHLGQALIQPYYPATVNYPTELLSQSYFDSYDWVAAIGGGLSASLNTTNNGNSAYFFTSFNVSPDYAVAINQYPISQGLATGSRSKVIGTSQYLYSIPFYDDHGRVIQVESTNYSNGLDYETTQYDFSGKPLRKLLTHQKSGTNAQAHVILTRNAYDAGSRPISIRKVIDGVEARVDTMYYNELGQLRAKYLGNTIDSLVYDYNIRGWVTGINRKYVTGTGSNYFGLELGYNNSASGVTTYSAPQFNGNIAGAVWKSAGDGVNRKYDFAYDNVNRLTGADFTQYNGSAFAKSISIDFSVPNITYDANGNILTMAQKGYKVGGAAPVDQLKYGYLANSNMLQQVYDSANDVNSKLGDFHYPGASKLATDIDYTYDYNGNLITDKNKGIRSIHYNFLNLPDTISMTKTDGSSKGNIVYKYDAGGNKVAKVVTDSTGSSVKITTTLYMQGFQYQNDTVQSVAHEEGRARWAFHKWTNGTTGYKWEFDFFEKDQLGNTREVLTQQRDTAQYLATMEAAYRSTENALFYNIGSTNVWSYYVNAASGPNPFGTSVTNPNDSVCRISGSTPKEGPAIVLKVMAGDLYKVGVNAFWKSGQTATGTTDALTEILSSLANGLVSVDAGAKGTYSSLSNTTTSPLLGGVNSFRSSNNPTPPSNPKAYLNYIALDDQFNYDAAASGAQAVGGADNLVTLATDTIRIKKNGYLYIYLSNETQNVSVFFDNLSITHYSGPLLEENSYYPFGLSMAGISDKALKANYVENKYRWNKGSELQNKEFADGSGLEMYETPLRELDPQLGRWWQIDPVYANGVDGDDEASGSIIEGLKSQSPYASMDNNPIRFEDPNGDCPPCIVEAFEALETGVSSGAFGAAAGYSSSSSSGSTMGPGEALLAALSPSGAWHGMQKAWNRITRSSESTTASEASDVGGASTGGTIVFNGVSYPTMAVQSTPAPTITLDPVSQQYLDKMNSWMGIHGNSIGSKKPTGNYENVHQSGKTYNGVGDKKRMNQSADRIAKTKKDPIKSQTWKPAPNKKTAYKREHKAIQKNGGAGNTKRNYNIRNSPGKKIK